MAKERGTNVVARNRKARHDYHIEDTVEAGLVLWGTEVKSLRAGRASLVDGFATIDRGEAWLEGVNNVGVTSGASVPEVLVDGVLEYLEGKGFPKAVEERLIEESLTFALPPELRKDLPKHAARH